MLKKTVPLMILFFFVVSLTTAWAKKDEKGEKELRDEIAGLQSEMSLLKQQNEQLKQMIDKLSEIMKPYAEKAENEKRQAAYHGKFEERTGRDLKLYSQQDLNEAEKLYRPANTSHSEEASKSLEKVIRKYPKCNRAGCSALYLGQRSTGDKKIQYLKLAIDNYGDCFYGDGVQVGAYARYVLAEHYQEIGRKDDAQKLFDEIKKLYPDAIDHSGKWLLGAMKEDK